MCLASSELLACERIFAWIFKPRSLEFNMQLKNIMVWQTIGKLKTDCQISQINPQITIPVQYGLKNLLLPPGHDNHSFWCLELIQDDCEDLPCVRELEGGLLRYFY